MTEKQQTILTKYNAILFYMICFKYAQFYLQMSTNKVTCTGLWSVVFISAKL